MQYLPVCLQVRNRRVLLVGGGVVATRKARLLLRAGAQLTVLSPDISDELASYDDSRVHHVRASWPCEYTLTGFMAVVAATPDRAVNISVSEACARANLPVNVVDDPELCSFIIPAIVDRDPLLIGITSSGCGPVAARRVRSWIETAFPPAYADVVAEMGKLRSTVAQTIKEESQRRYFWEALLDSPWAEAIMSRNAKEAENHFRQLLADPAVRTRGAVYLIGAGPGDPDLMTFKALRLLQQADVVLYDRLIGPGILEMCRRDAEKIYVGKERSAHAMPQSDINSTLLSLALEGKKVARLKGGDPFIFGRGGEEIEGLLEAGIHFEVVPGITAASGAACYGGIPLTHRDHAQSVRFITGHTKNHQLDLPWHEFLNEHETLVFYMGLAGLSIICDALMAAGRPRSTPIALVERATRVDQRVLTGTLETICARVAEVKPQAPTLLIIGSVVTLHPSLQWYGARRP